MALPESLPLPKSFLPGSSGYLGRLRSPILFKSFSMMQSQFVSAVEIIISPEMVMSDFCFSLHSLGPAF